MRLWRSTRWLATHSTMSTDSEHFEATICRLTEPLNDQYPRPWMTDLTDPLLASLFIVGRNQAKGYQSERVTHQRHIDALFNRSGETCRRLYDEMTGFSPSPTRKNTDSLRSLLLLNGVTRVLETNVVCYSTPMSRGLRFSQHKGGIVRGSEIFQALLYLIKPKVLVAHGSGTRVSLSKLLGTTLPAPPAGFAEPESTVIDGITIFVIPSLAPPKWNEWSGWADRYLRKVASAAASAL